MVQLVQIGKGMSAWRSVAAAVAVPAWVLANASLDIDIANNRAWGVGIAETTADAVLACTRASSGMALNANGIWTPYGNNLLRRSDLGANIEQSRTQVLLQSTDLTNAAWVATSATVTGGQASPDGTTNAATLLDLAAASNHFFGNSSVTFTNGISYLFCVRAKAGTSNFLQMTHATTRFSGAGYANFDLSTGTVTQTGGTLVGATCLSEGNGWYNCFIVATATSTGTGQAILARIHSGTDTRLLSYTGDAQTVLVWNPNIFGSVVYVTSPIYTTGSTSARATDNIVPSAAAIALMQAAKSGYSETQRLLGGTTPRIVDFGGTASLQIASGRAGTTVSTVGASTAAATIGSAGTVYGLVKSAFSFDGSNNKAIANGGTQVTTAGAWGVTTETPQIGNNAALALGLNGYLGRLAFSASPGNFDALTV